MRKKCYICHEQLKEISVYNSCLCPKCGTLNYSKRFQTGNLEGKIALITGGRFNIGYETALKLLRAGAKVYITTRFPADASERFSKEKDFKEWKENFNILQCDFRNLSGVTKMIQWLNSSLPYLDILINNAAQTIRRPYEYYRGLVDIEEKIRLYLPTESRTLIKLETSSNFEKIQKNLDLMSGQPGNPDDFPLGKVDLNGWPLDLREKNSWNLEASEISPIEFLEVQTVNSTVPFMLCSYLKELFLKSPHQNKYIINVAASAEGSFSYPRNNSKHVHLNMAKASLNMLTHTLWKNYRKDKIWINSVDTGWVNYEGTWKAQVTFFKELERKVPLDPIDGASRLLDPIFQNLEVGGKIYKDYQEEEFW